MTSFLFPQTTERVFVVAIHFVREKFEEMIDEAGEHTLTHF